MSAGYTDADVQLVAEEIRATDCNSSSDAARAILAALAGAGRLTPDGAEVREEYSVWHTKPDGEAVVTTYSHPKYTDVAEAWAREFQGLHGGVIKRRTLVHYAGPWVEADEDSTG